MNKINNFLFLIACMTVILSCEKEVVLDFGEEQQNLAIFSLFSPNDIFSASHNFNVEVSATQSILNNESFNFIKDANVSISAEPIGEPEKTISETLSFKNSDSDRIQYRSDNTIPQDGFLYKLTVEHDDFPTVKAISHVPAKTEIKNLELSEFKKSKEDQIREDVRYFSNASFEIENQASGEHQYHLLVWLVFQNGVHRTIYIEEDLLQEQLGTEATIINTNSSLVFFGAHFDDKNFEDSSEKLNFDIAFTLSETEMPIGIKVELRSVSKEYNRYFVEGYRLSKAGNNPFFVESNNISNNVENGFGVFAGYSSFNVEVPFRR